MREPLADATLTRRFLSVALTTATRHLMGSANLLRQDDLGSGWRVSIGLSMSGIRIGAFAQWHFGTGFLAATLSFVTATTSPYGLAASTRWPCSASSAGSFGWYGSWRTASS
jgi:hypothetical protein